MLPSLRLRRCREQPPLLLVAREAWVLVEGGAPQILGPRGDYRLVGGPPSQTRRSRAEGIERSRPGGGVVANRSGYLGGRALLGELEGGAGYGGGQHVLGEGGRYVGCAVNVCGVCFGDGAVRYDRGRRVTGGARDSPRT